MKALQLIQEIPYNSIKKISENFRHLELRNPLPFKFGKQIFDFKQTIANAFGNQVTITFVGGTQSVSSDNQGKFHISSKENYSQIKISYIGFKTATRQIEPGKEQSINIALIADNQLLNEVVVKSGKKVKYHNKNNPAVELIRQVIAHKEKNRIENYDYAEYKQYE